ncbi:MAG TPA: YicC/YloC family endoribonuclease [Pirellulaceae bacterium]|nr:YicC/YloC family endoribonuclease [Pirellulaceae bacterium]
MTGHGEAHRRHDTMAVAVEVRTINSRYFKLNLRTGDAYSNLEPQVEAVVRERIRRGTIQVTLRIEREPSPDDFQVSDVVLASYHKQLTRLSEQLRLAEGVTLSSLLALPGVVVDQANRRHDIQAEWPLIEETILAALDSLATMRNEEGKAMAADLVTNCATISRELDLIVARAPSVSEAYRTRLTDRLNKLLADYEVKVTAVDIVREVGVFAERSDIAEETVRLKSHLEQFDTIMRTEESCGRKLEFITQEMFRETNTMGSKANDAEISRHVIEIKSAIERMREMIQNIE